MPARFRTLESSQIDHSFQIVKPECAERTAASLSKICVDEGSVLLKTYDVAHAVTEKEIVDIIEFMVSKSES